jgi:hypothetical protein
MASDNSAGFHNPAFAINKVAPVHRWVPWIAGFAGDFVRGALERYLPCRGRVLDPFAGVGTTLVEAFLAGHDAVGFETNPYAALACRTKTAAHHVSVEALCREVERFEGFYSEHSPPGYEPVSQSPAGFKSRTPFYSPVVLRKVLILWDFIDTVTNETLRDFFRLAFASTMVRYSNYSYEPSLGRRVSAGKEEIHDFAVAELVVDKLREMIEDVAWLQERLPDRSVGVEVINRSFMRYAEFLPRESVDLVVTSPPYLNNYHYNRNTRPHLYWLGFVASPADMKPLEDMNFGKFWQTVRALDYLGLDFELPGSDIAQRLALLRGLNAARGIYGGNGWANYAAAYFNDCYSFARGLDYVLRPGGTALVVIGNSILQGMLIPTDQYLGQIGEAVGLELVGVHVPRATRVGNSIIQSNVRVGRAEDSHQLYEAVVELRRPE